MRNGADIAVFRGGGVAAGALQQHQMFASGFAGDAHRFIEFAGACHARGHDHRLAGARHSADERMIGVLERRHLVAGRIEALQKVHGGFVKRRGKGDHAARPGAGKDRAVPLPRRVGLLIELVERGAAPQAVGIGDAEAFGIDIQCHGISGIGLQLQRVRAGIGGGIHQRHRAIQRLVVITGHFGDDEGGVIRPHHAAFDGEILLRTHGLTFFSNAWETGMYPARANRLPERAFPSSTTARMLSGASTRFLSQASAASNSAVPSPALASGVV